jgi:hypothetical protein
VSIVQNERIKLRANALDRASTACLAVGVLGPAVGFLYGVSAANVPRLLLVIGSTMWLSAAVALHLLSWRTLGGLK